MNLHASSLVFVGIGGAIGSIIRYCFYLLEKNLFSNTNLPLATLSVNLIGCFAIGCFLSKLQSATLSPILIQFLLVGVLGGFTTFSTFSLENLRLIIEGKFALALGYMLTSCVLGLSLTYLGYILFRGN